MDKREKSLLEPLMLVTKVVPDTVRTCLSFRHVTSRREETPLFKSVTRKQVNTHLQMIN